MSDMSKAKDLFATGQYTLVMIGNGLPITTPERGVRPLVQLLDSGLDCKGFCAVDKIVGRAAAFLHILLGTKEIHATVMTKSAVEMLQGSDIAVSYDTLVDSIDNSDKTGPCPMEAAVANIRDSFKALKAIKDALKN